MSSNLKDHQKKKKAVLAILDGLTVKESKDILYALLVEIEEIGVVDNKLKAQSDEGSNPPSGPGTPP